MTWFFRKIEILRRIRELILVTDMAKQSKFLEAANSKLNNSETLSITETLKLTLKCAGMLQSDWLRPSPNQSG